MHFINDEEFPSTQPVAEVLNDRCDGCAFCVDACPTAALSLKENPERLGHRIITVLAVQCQGCGACQATCPKEAICIPGLSTEDLRRYIDRAVAAV